MQKNIEQLKQKLEFAADVMKRLPRVRAQGYRNFWPAVKHSQKEIREWESLPVYIRPTAEEISLMDKILDWYRPLDPEETKLVWLRAARTPWKIIGRMFNQHRSTLNEKYNCAVGKMLGYLYRRPGKDEA